MLDTKSKNRHKQGIFLIVISLLLATVVVLGNYTAFNQTAGRRRESQITSYQVSKSFMKTFIRDCYVLYSKESGNETTAEYLSDYYPEFEEGFNSQIAYMNYQVQDEKENVLDGYRSNEDSWEKVENADLTDYALGIRLSFDKNGEIKVEQVTGDHAAKQEAALKVLTSNLSEKLFEYEDQEVIQKISPKNRTYYFMLTEKQISSYISRRYPIDLLASDAAVYVVGILMLVIALLAWIIPLKKNLQTGDEKIFHVPFEVAAVIGIAVVSMTFENMGGMITHANGGVWPIDFLTWFMIFAVVYWVSGCMRQIWILGIREYLKTRTLLLMVWRRFGNGIRRCVRWCRDKIEELYHSLAKFDFKERNNKIILKIVCFNFLILLVICSFWYYGIFGLVVYSVLLFLILQKYFNDLRKKYALLLQATNEIAEGNLDVEIEGDLGVFSPFRNEIQKIQRGFKKAVKEEVKSQRMKTELITNVSHDLKTPLTAIITYVNLLKEEKDEEKRQDYIQVLERKSMRLKVLIEDLFEISKASSQNVTLNLMDVDIVNLFKQVKFELEDKFTDKNLEFRCTFPEEKVILCLDSQKTYRIFENLLNNIAKYALPGTRVYVEIEAAEKDVFIRLKNISATELTFNPEEITERFVRGDESRNTEGSGLGLAIVKSFVRLQSGSFHIETEADLFKAEIRWPRKRMEK